MNTLDNLAKKLSDCSDEGERVSRERGKETSTSLDTEYNSSNVTGKKKMKKFLMNLFVKVSLMT